MKKVFHLISTMNIGGAETMVKDYALLMDKKLFDVKIITLDKSYCSVNEQILEEAKIPVIHLSELHFAADNELKIWQKIFRRIARYYDLRKIIKNERPDVLHVHLYIGNYLKLIPLKKWGIKLLYTVHNVPEHYYDPTGKNKRKYKAYKEIKRLLKKENLHLIALHDEMNFQLKKLFATEHVITVYNGINLERFHKELYDREAIRKELNIARDVFVVGHVGRFHEQKNHELIVDIYNEVSKIRNSHLLLIGEGDLKDDIENKIQLLGLTEQVTILKNRRDIPELMSAMDVFLFPSRWEGFGNVLIEAQSMGVPCVVSDVIAPSVILNKNVTIHSINTGIDEWKEAVLNAGSSMISAEIQKYDIKNCVLQLQKIYIN